MKKHQGMRRILAMTLAAVTVWTQAPTAYAAEPPAEIVFEEETEEDLLTETAAEEDPSAAEAEAMVEAPLSPETEDADGEAAVFFDADGAAQDPLTDSAAEQGVPMEEGAVPDALLSKVSPGAYAMSAEDYRDKQLMNDHNVVETLTTLAAGEDYVTGQVLCMADSEAEAEQIAKAYGGELAHYSYGIATISLKQSGLTVTEAVQLGCDPSVALPVVEPLYIIRREEPAEESAGENPADLFEGEDAPTAQNWSSFYYDLPAAQRDPALDPQDEHYQYMHDLTNTWGAWGVTMGSHEVTVAVIDTGVLAEHEELAGRVTTHEVSTTLDDGTVTGLGTMPADSHATHVAGIIAAAAGNGVGGAGIAPGVKILSLCVQRWTEENGRLQGGMPFDAIAEAVWYVAGRNEDGSMDPAGRRADIINMSLGSYFYSEIVDKAVTGAWQAGVTVCASMGNNDANIRCYPSCLDHVIAVSSVEQSARRSEFSNYGKWADVAAPGSSIWSSTAQVNPTINEDGTISVLPAGGGLTFPTDQYEFMNGTSMATPVVAGVCALYMSAVGHVDPDTMEAVIKKSTRKSESKNIGVGVIDASLLFSADKTGPVITVYEGEKVIGNAQSGQTASLTSNISMTAAIRLTPGALGGGAESFSGDPDLGGIILYTTDGKAPSIREGEILHGTRYDPATPLSAGALVTNAGGKVTLKAACVSGVGVLSKVTTIKLTVAGAPATVGQLLETVTVTGQRFLVPGTAAKFKVLAALPKTAKNKKVTWSIAPEVAGVTIDAGGTVKVAPGTVSTEIFTVKATAQDGGGAFGTAEFALVSSKASKVVIDTETTDSFYQLKRNARAGNTVSTARLYNVDVGHDKEGNVTEENRLVLRAQVIAGTAEVPGSLPLWTSSNPALVAFEGEDADHTKTADTVTLIARGTKAGKATITCMAQDGSKKKATLKITVTVPASSLTLTSAEDRNSVGIGKTLPLKPVFGTTYGTPTAGKVQYTWEAGEQVYDADEEQYYFSPVPAHNKYVSISSKGVLKIAASGYRDLWLNAGGSPVVQVTAVTTDGTDLLVTRQFEIAPPITKLYFRESGGTSSKKTSKTISMGLESQRLFQLQGDATSYRAGFIKVTPFIIVPELQVTSSNPEVAAGSYFRDDNGEYYLSVVTGRKSGTATLTIKTREGSNRKATLKVKASSDLVSRIAIEGPDYVAPGTEAQYTATVEPSTARNRVVAWYLYRDSGEKGGCSVDQRGKVTIAGDFPVGETCKLYAEATDGSEVYGVKTITVARPIRLTTAAVSAAYQVNKGDEGAVESLQLFTINTPDVDADGKQLSVNAVDERSIEVKAIKLTDVAGTPEWACTDPTVVQMTPAADGMSATLTAQKTGSAAVTCTLDGSVETVAVTVVMPMQNSDLTVTGPETVIKGKKGAYTATVAEDCQASSRTVRWSLEEESVAALAGVTINAETGEVSVATNSSALPTHTFTVTATATDGSGAHASADFRVLSAAKSITVTTTATSKAYNVRSSSGSVYSLRLYTLNSRDVDADGKPLATDGGIDERRITLSAEMDNGEIPVWTSDNTAVGFLQTDGSVADTVKGGTATLVCQAEEAVKSVKILCKSESGSPEQRITVNVEVPLRDADLRIEGTTRGSDPVTSIRKGKMASFNLRDKEQTSVTADWSISGIPEESYTISGLGNSISVRIQADAEVGATATLTAVATDGSGAMATTTFTVAE